MFIWGSYERELQEGTGQFHCPRCNTDRDFTLIRTWLYSHIYFIPIAKQQLLAEHVVCIGCNRTFPTTVLSGEAESVSCFGTGRFGLSSQADDSRNIVTLTASAVEEIKRRHFEGEFEPNVAVRIEPDIREPNRVSVAFDVLLDDGRDWIGESCGIPILVDRRFRSPGEQSG